MPQESHGQGHQVLGEQYQDCGDSHSVVCARGFKHNSAWFHLLAPCPHSPTNTTPLTFSDLWEHSLLSESSLSRVASSRSYHLRAKPKRRRRWLLAKIKSGIKSRLAHHQSAPPVLLRHVRWNNSDMGNIILPFIQHSLFTYYIPFS